MISKFRSCVLSIIKSECNMSFIKTVLTCGILQNVYKNSINNQQHYARHVSRQFYMKVSHLQLSAYNVCQKSDTLLDSEFSTLVRCIICNFCLLTRDIIFINIRAKCRQYTDGLSSRMVHHRTLRKTR